MKIELSKRGATHLYPKKEDDDLVSTTAFNFLACTGCRQHHKVLGIGCDPLRIVQILIHPWNLFSLITHYRAPAFSLSMSPTTQALGTT
jgi:hypothetical protein